MTTTSDPRIVIALGGNALGDSPAQQLTNLGAAVPSLVNLIESGYEIVVTHGNGPQVGLISKVFELGVQHQIAPPGFDLAECTALSQGYIGYHLQQCLQRELHCREMPYHVATVVTQVEVDPGDPAFQKPTKPVGSFVGEAQAREMMAAESGLTMVEDSGRGWRRVVASPKPRRIVEEASILHLLDHEFVVVACGGGGVPVISDGEDGYLGVPAVIDKDLASALLAEAVDATVLVILTAIDGVAIDFGKPTQRTLREMTLADVARYTAEGQFAAGSMLPKVEAAANFVAGGPGRIAVICDLQDAARALRGEVGTRITA